LSQFYNQGYRTAKPKTHKTRNKQSHDKTLAKIHKNAKGRLGKVELSIYVISISQISIKHLLY